MIDDFPKFPIADMRMLLGISPDPSGVCCLAADVISIVEAFSKGWEWFACGLSESTFPPPFSLVSVGCYICFGLLKCSLLFWILPLYFVIYSVGSCLALILVGSEGCFGAGYLEVVALVIISEGLAGAPPWYCWAIPYMEVAGYIVLLIT